MKPNKAIGTYSDDIVSADVPGLMTVKQFCARYPWPSESAMRAIIYRATDLSLQNAFVRVGRRVLVNSEKFFLAIQDQTKRSQGGNHETLQQGAAQRSSS